MSQELAQTEGIRTNAVATCDLCVRQKTSGKDVINPKHWLERALIFCSLVPHLNLWHVIVIAN